MPPKSKPASAPRRPRLKTTPGPSNAELAERLEFLANVLGTIMLAIHEKMPPKLMFDIVERCGIQVTHLVVGPEGDAVH